MDFNNFDKLDKIENNNYSVENELLQSRLTAHENYDSSSRPSDPSYDYQFRLIVVGDSNVGKTALLRCFTNNPFRSGEDATVGVDFNIRNMKLDGNRIKLHLWDTAGQEKFRFLCQSYYRNSIGVVVAFSLLSRPSWAMVDAWVAEARQFAGPEAPSVIVVGTKLDLVEVGCRREVSQTEAREAAETLGALYMETSAKQGVGVEDAFKILSKDILDRIERGDISLSQPTDSVKLGKYRSYRSGSLCWSRANQEKRNSCCF